MDFFTVGTCLGPDHEDVRLEALVIDKRRQWPEC